MAQKSKPDPQPPRMLNPKDAAQRLGTNYAKILALVRAGEIKHLRLGKQYLIPESEITSFIARNLTATWVSRRKTVGADFVSPTVEAVA